MVTPLCRPVLEDVSIEVDRLLGRRGTSYLDLGRVVLLVCNVCQDLLCGALTVRLDVMEQVVTWSDWRWDPIEHAEKLTGISAPVVVDRAAYEGTIQSAPEVLATLPYDQDQFRTRPFLWPWQWGWRLPRDG